MGLLLHITPLALPLQIPFLLLSTGVRAGGIWALCPSSVGEKVSALVGSQNRVGGLRHVTFFLSLWFCTQTSVLQGLKGS